MGSLRAEAPVALIRALADGAVHSERALCKELGIGAPELARQVEGLPALGLEPRAVGGGWRLPRPLDLLDPAVIVAALQASERARITDLIALDQVDSTNAELKRRTSPDSGGVLVCVAEHQSAGRGRHQRRWIAAYAQGLCLSLRWRFPAGAGAASGLSLALGVAVRRALADQGVSGIQLRWPNDLLAGERKLGGILIEAVGATPCDLIAGIGLNWRLPPALGQAIDQPWIDLAALATAPPKRNRLAAGVIGHALAATTEFAAAGLDPFLAEWRAADAYAGREVAVGEGAGRVVGTSLGIDADGSLRLATPGGERRVFGGEIEVRG